VVTGIVQEFQFGMNSSAYSKFVGNVFGAPLAMEALLTFFLESTFIGIWIFGWNKLSPRLHLASIWLVSIGTSLSALFILAANSWMQHPVGYRVDPATHRVVLTSIVALLTNPTVLATWPHVFFAAFMVAGAVIVAASAWHVARRSHPEVFGKAMRLGLVVTLLAGIATAVTGDVAGPDDGVAAADEDGRRRGAVHHPVRRVVLAVHHRLNWYGLLGGLVTLTLFTLHGAIFLSLRTVGELRQRARRTAVLTALAAVFLAVITLTALAAFEAVTALPAAASARPGQERGGPDRGGGRHARSGPPPGPPLPAAGAAGDGLDRRRQCHVPRAGHHGRSGY
jgi:bd-type cytochrome oxidase subunit I/bd-type cytochrome oxidase subunit II